MASERRDILPEERVKPASARSLASVLVIAGVLVLAANFAASAALKALPVNRGYALANGKWKLMDRALESRTKLDVLIVGDSSSNQGLNPKVIREVTGKTAMNLGVVAEARTIEPVWTADRFLEQSTKYKGAPRTILWMHVYDIWSRDDKGDRRLRGITASLPSTAWPYIERGPKVRFTARDLWLMQQVPLYFQNLSLSNLARRPFASIEEARRFKYDETGFTAETTPDLSLVQRDTRNHMKLVREDPDTTFTTIARKSIDAMAQLAAKYKAEVWIVQSPINRTLWQDPVFRQRWQSVTDTLRAAAARYPHMHVTFDEPVLFDDVRMQNCDHVLADAATEFTRAVIDRTGLRQAVTRPTTAHPQPTTKAE